MIKKLVFVFTFLFVVFSFTKEIHPYHVGSVEFNYSLKSKTYQITGRFFLDDLENSINRKYGSAVHFQDDKFKKEMNEVLKRYCDEYLKLKSDNQFITIKYLGFEEDRESVNIYLETEAVPTPKKVETSVSMLYNLFDDQSNIIHISVNGIRKSTKLNFPDRYSYQIF